MKRKFEETIEYIKGTYGEMIIGNRLREYQYSVLTDDEPIAHSFDIYLQKDKNYLKKVEVKTYPSFDKFADNGINFSTFKDYQFVDDNSCFDDLLIIWIDTEVEKWNQYVELPEIYCNDFSELLKTPFNRVHGSTGQKIRFGLKYMVSFSEYFNIEDEAVSNLSISELENFKIIEELSKKLIVSDDEVKKLVYDLFYDNKNYFNQFLNYELPKLDDVELKRNVKNNI